MLPFTPEVIGVDVLVGAPTVGHSANSQLGPVRPTDEPSGQILASIVQATDMGADKCFLSVKTPSATTMIITAKAIVRCLIIYIDVSILLIMTWN